MSKNKRTPLIALLSFFSISGIAFADVPLNPALQPQQQAAPTNSNAIAFGVQAGAIAGTAQACGQDITTFTTRVGEAINKLALNNADKLMAITEFQKSLQQAQTTESNNHTIPCTQVMQDFNNLPLLRPDYEQTVIAQLNPTMTNNATTNQPAATANTPSPVPQTNATLPNTTNNPTTALQQLPQTSPSISTNQPALATPPSNLSQPVYSNSAPAPVTPPSTYTYPSSPQSTASTSSSNASIQPTIPNSTSNVGQNTTTGNGGQ